MAKMIRKQVYIEAEQEELLKRRSRELGITESELIRLGIDQLARPRVSFFDPKSWEEALEFMKARAKIEVPQTGRTWTRDELYEERLERFSR